MTPRVGLTRPPTSEAAVRPRAINHGDVAAARGRVTLGDFLDANVVGLHRFAAVLCDSFTIAEELTQQAVLRTVNDLGADIGTEIDPARMTTAARTWIVRGYLSAGMRLGEPPAADVDQPIPRSPHDPVIRADVPADDLADRFQHSSKLQRTVVLLRYSAGLSDRAVADMVGSTADGITQYFVDVLARLDVSAPDSVEEHRHSDADLAVFVVRLVGSGDTADLGRRLASRLPAAHRPVRTGSSSTTVEPAPRGPAERVAARTATAHSNRAHPTARTAPARTTQRPVGIASPVRLRRLGAFATWVVGHALIVAAATVLIIAVAAVLGESIYH